MPGTKRKESLGEVGRPSKGERRSISGLQPLREVPTPPSPHSYPYSGTPEQFDVSSELLDAIAPADGEMSVWKTEHAAFIKSAAGLEDTTWIGKRPLGSGTFGTAGLWERRDANNVLIEVLSRLPFDPNIRLTDGGANGDQREQRKSFREMDCGCSRGA